MMDMSFYLMWVTLLFLQDMDFESNDLKDKKFQSTKKRRIGGVYPGNYR